MKEWVAEILDHGCKQFKSRKIVDDDSLKDCYKLRHKIFVEKLSWVPGNEDMLDYDRYDERAHHYGVYDSSDNLAGYIRALYDRPYMLELEFGCNSTIEESSAEVSRLAVNPELNQAERLIVTMMLYRMVYRDMMSEELDWWYMATTKQLHDKLKMIMPVEHLHSIGNGMQGEIIRLNNHVARNEVGALKNFFIDMPMF